MANLTVTLETMEAQEIHGVWGKSSDRTVSKDIPRLSAEYYQAVGKKEGEVLPFYVLSRNYDPRTEAFELLIAGDFAAPPLAAFTLEADLYARITVRPKLGFLWGPAVGEAKRYFYTKWLPGSGYAARNLEYELHTEKSVGKAPSIDLLFAVRGKD